MTADDDVPDVAAAAAAVCNECLLPLVCCAAAADWRKMLNLPLFLRCCCLMELSTRARERERSRDRSSWFYRCAAIATAAAVERWKDKGGEME